MYTETVRYGKQSKWKSTNKRNFDYIQTNKKETN